MNGCLSPADDKKLQSEENLPKGLGAVAKSKLPNRIQAEKKFERESFEEILLWIHNQIEVFFCFEEEIFDKDGKNIKELRISVVARKGMTYQRFLDSIVDHVGAVYTIDDTWGIMLYPARKGKGTATPQGNNKGP